MDSLTQIVLGAAVGEAVLGKKIGSRAMLWGAIAGTIPDLDVFVRFFTDNITATQLHRGISHSLFFSIVMAPLLAWIAHKIHSKRDASRWDWTKLFFWGLVTHPLLDMHTDWGTQFFWPFEYRVAYKNIFVADPIYTVPFLIFVLLALFTKRTNPRRAKFNNWGLIISSTYMALTIVFKLIGISHFKEDLKKQHIAYVELETRPTPLNSTLWNGQIETKTGFRMAYYSLLDSKPVQFSREFPKNHHLLDPIKNQKKIKQLIDISVGWYIVEDHEDHLNFYDIRFGQFGIDPDNSPFVWCYEIYPQDGADAKIIRKQPDMGNMSSALAALWERLKGN